MSKSVEELLEQRDSELREALDRIVDLEEQLEELDNSYIFSESEKMMLKIIEHQVARFWKQLSNGDFSSLDKDEVKAFDTFVKDFVALRGKMPKRKEKEIEESEENIAELVALAKGE